MAIELTPFDAAAHITEADDLAELLADALATNDAHTIAGALGIVARARGMTQVERDTGMKRQALYRALGPEGNPTMETLLKVLPALGLKLSIDPAHA